MAFLALGAVLAYDTQITGTGITTVDSLCCGYMDKDTLRKDMFGMSLDALKRAREKELLKADHLLHLRCEVCDAHVLEMFEPYVNMSNLHLVYLMDHTSGERQYRDLEVYCKACKHMHWTDARFQEMVKIPQKEKKYVPVFTEKILALCQEYNIPVTSHDDTTKAQGEEAARAAREHGLGVVRGGSVSAETWPKRDCWIFYPQTMFWQA